MRATSKNEMIARLSAKTGLSRNDAEKAWRAVVEIVQENVEEGRNLSFAPVGLLKVKRNGPREIYAPKAAGTCTVPARHSVTFLLNRSFDRDLRKALSEKEAKS